MLLALERLVKDLSDLKRWRYLEANPLAVLKHGAATVMLEG